jgi:hypothetical protein
MGTALGPFTMQELTLQGLLLVSLIVKSTYSMFSDEKNKLFIIYFFQCSGFESGSVRPVTFWASRIRIRIT